MPYNGQIPDAPMPMSMMPAVERFRASNRLLISGSQVRKGML